jgi:hypothetical protein
LIEKSGVEDVEYAQSVSAQYNERVRFAVRVVFVGGGGGLSWVYDSNTTE